MDSTLKKEEKWEGYTTGYKFTVKLLLLKLIKSNLILAPKETKRGME